MRHFYRFFLVSLAFLVLAAALSWGAGEQEGEAGSGPAEATDELVVYTYDVFPDAMQKAVESHFTEQYGVTVDFQRFADTGGLYNQVYLERNNPKADVAIGLDTTYLGRIFDNELFASYEPENLQLDKKFLRVDPEHRAIPFDYGHIALNYNSAQVEDPPQSWQELTAERFRDSIVMLNPGTSSPGRNFFLLTIAELGTDRYLDFWRELKPNILTVTDGWSEGYGLYTQGEAPIVVSYETSPPYHIEFEDTRKYQNLFVNGKAYAQVEVAGIIDGAQNRVNAERFMEFILSEEFQKLIPLNQFMYPVHPGVELPESFQQIETAEDVVLMDESRVAENYEQWLSDWEEVMR
jgi:thiamine transport system substrate-binding protein